MYVEVKMKGIRKKFLVKLASGDTRHVSFESHLRRRFRTDNERNEKQNPYYTYDPLRVLERTIEDGDVIDGVNYALVESFQETETEEIEHTVYLKLSVGFFGNSFRWYEHKI